MDEYTVEIDELHDDVVMLAVPALRLLVFGRSTEEAMARARAAIDFRCHEPDRRPNPSLRSYSSQLRGVGRLRRPRPDCSVESRCWSRHYTHDPAAEADLAVQP
jgi:hypothetical protein